MLTRLELNDHYVVQSREYLFCSQHRDKTNNVDPADTCSNWILDVAPGTARGLVQGSVGGGDDDRGTHHQEDAIENGQFYVGGFIDYPEHGIVIIPLPGDQQGFRIFIFTRDRAVAIGQGLGVG